MSQREAIIELGGRGSGGDLDHTVLCDLFSLELIEVMPSDRRIRLTAQGLRVYRELVADAKAK